MFWYKGDLRTYLVAATGDPAMVAALRWDEIKRRIADEFVQQLVADQDRHRELLLRLMIDVAAVEEFSKLQNTEDSEKKIAEAQTAVAGLRKYVKPYEQEMLEQERAKERIEEARTAATEHRHVEEKLALLKERYEELVVLDDAQERGRLLIWSAVCQPRSTERPPHGGFSQPTPRSSRGATSPSGQLGRLPSSG